MPLQRLLSVIYLQWHRYDTLLIPYKNRFAAVLHISIVGAPTSMPSLALALDMLYYMYSSI